jgi:multicomponent Na+:H+ antiporter subunit F
MLALAIDVALVVASGITLLSAYRVVLGPTTADRVVALDTIATDVVAIAVLFALRESVRAGVKSGHFFVDIGLVLAIIGFVSTIAVARYLTEGDIIE